MNPFCMVLLQLAFTCAPHAGTPCLPFFSFLLMFKKCRNSRFQRVNNIYVRRLAIYPGNLLSLSQIWILNSRVWIAGSQYSLDPRFGLNTCGDDAASPVWTPWVWRWWSRWCGKWSSDCIGYNSFWSWVDVVRGVGTCQLSSIRVVYHRRAIELGTSRGWERWLQSNSWGVKVLKFCLLVF